MATLLALLLLAANPNPDADSQAIKVLVSSFREAVEKGDGKALLETFWSDAVVFEHGSVDRTAKAFVDAHFRAGLRIKWAEEENLGRSEGTMAYVAQRAVIDRTEKDVIKRAPNTLSFVFRKREGEWKIAHLHWSAGKGVVVTASAADAGS